jgi:hypothetical protein
MQQMYQQPTWSRQAQEQFAERQAAQRKQGQFLKRIDRFMASWTALAGEYNEK